MNAKLVVLTFTVLLALVCMGSPLSRDKNGMGKSKARSLERRSLASGATGPGKTEQTRAERLQRLASLPEDQREFMSKQLLQALSEIIQRDDCISDYQGWVDFGRSTD